MNKVLLGTAVTLLAASSAFAQNYQAEFRADYLNGDVRDNDFDGFALSAQAHLDKVDTTKGPLNEAAFLDKSSFVDLSWLTLDFDEGGSDDTLSLEGRFVTQGNMIVEAGFSDFENDEAYSVGLGMYVNDALDAVLAYETFDEADRSSLALDFHGVQLLNRTASLAYDYGVSVIDLNDETGYEGRLGADYYFNTMVSVGASLAWLDVDEFDSTTWQVGVDYFVTPLVRVGAEFITQGQDVERDSLGINASIRI